MRLAAALAVSIGVLTAVGAAPAAPGTRRAPATRLVFSAITIWDRDQGVRDEQIYSVDNATRRVAQLTFDAQPSADPLPSPDGRLVVFLHSGGVWLMNEDGRRQRRLVAQGIEPAWSRHSGRIAYVAVDASNRRLGLRTIGVDGRDDRLLARGEDVARPAWSPDGRALSFQRGASLVVLRNGSERVLARDAQIGAPAPPTWSPDGRWIAYVAQVGDGPVQVVLIRFDASTRRVVGEGQRSSWSPDGRLLAYAAPDAVVLFDPASGTSRELVTGLGLPANSLAWSPANNAIAFATTVGQGAAPIDVVSLSGRVTRIAAYPEASEVTWTRPPTGLHFRSPSALGPLASGNELLARAPIDDLAADGGRVAYRLCGAIGVWRPGDKRTASVRTEAPLCGTGFLGFFDLTLAGDVVGYGTDEGGIQQHVALELSTLGSPLETIVPGTPFAIRGNVLGAGFLLGKGALVVFSTWARGCNGAATSCPDPSASQPLWRLPVPLAPGTCGRTGVDLGPPCVKIADGPVAPLAVDGSRVAVLQADGSVALLGADGRPEVTLPFAPRVALGAEIAGDDLVVLVAGGLRDYDAANGALLHAWPLPDVSSAEFCGIEVWRCGPADLRLEGAAHGLVVYVLDGRVHLLRLGDGADVVVGDGTAAALDDAGLFYAYRSTGSWPGRILFVPFDELPVR